MTSYTDLKDLNASDRDNLADVLWWLKGYNHSGKSPFCEDHEESIERVISAIRNKINDEKNGQGNASS